MARKLRLEFPGAVYHVMSRGDRGEPIVLDDNDRELFLLTLAEACEKTGWQVFAYCLMRNHFHFVVETPKADLSPGMHWFLSTYTMRFNRRHNVIGHVFSGRYKAIVVDTRNHGYLRKVVEYVHLNPIRASLLGPDAPLQQYRWSSYPAYLRSPNQRPAWLRVERALWEMGIPRDTKAGRRQFEKLMEMARHRDNSEADAELEQGWCLGDPEFRKELLQQIESRRGPSHGGRELKESAVEAAEKLVQEILQQLGWNEEDLKSRPKGDSAKVEAAHVVNVKTTMSIEWIAKRLHMGTRGSLSNLLSKHRRWLAEAANRRTPPAA